MILYVLKNLVNNMSTLIIIAYFISKVRIFKSFVIENKNTIKDKLLLSLVFGTIGIIATYTGISVNGAIANSRIVGVMVGGIFGGPIVGLGAGLIAGIHRWAIDIGGFTSVACMMSTVVEGIIGGMASQYIKFSRLNWFHSFIIGIFAELIQMLIILTVARPFEAAFELVKIIWIPMVIFNPIGIAVFVGLINGIYKEQEKEAAIQTQLALDIAEKCLPYLRKGLNNTKDVFEVAKIILDMSGSAAVAITDSNTILAHVGVGEDHHQPNNPVKTYITKKVLATGEIVIAQTKKEIGCEKEYCKLMSAVIVPLFKNKQVVGTIKIYKTRDNAISDIDIRLAEGLAKLFSTQLELSNMDYQVKLREKAELKALQSQINPHFLFNALNTIISFCRVKPERARELLIDLSTYFRNTLQYSEDFVSLETEMKHVNAYLSLEKARFEDKLDVFVKIDSTLDCMLPQLILQPIVENSVKHGLLPKKDGGRIQINSYIEDGHVIIKIDDTGIGIDENIIYKLYNNELPENKIGLYNVHNRLKSIYGKTYGLNVKRLDSGGTSVTIKIPNKMIGEEYAV